MELLRNCLRLETQSAKTERLCNYSAQDWQNISDAAMRQGIVPLLFHTLKPISFELSIPPTLFENMQRMYYLATGRNMRIFRHLANIICIFNRKGIPVILLKGVHFAEYVYENPSLRSMGDIDLLVMKEHLGCTHELLIDEGYHTEEENAGKCLEHVSPYRKQNALKIDVHFNITRPPVSQRFDIADVWQRARHISFQGKDALILCPEDFMLHLAAHTCIHHVFDNGLVPYIDVCQLVSRYENEMDWQRLWQRAEEWGIERSVYLIFALTEQLLGLPVPRQVPFTEIQQDSHMADAINTAKMLMTMKSPGVSSFIARLFDRRGRRMDLAFILKLAFPPRHIILVSKHDCPNSSHRFCLYRLYIRRLRTLFMKHAKSFWSGLTRDPRTAQAFHIEHMKNHLRDWLTHS